MYYVHLDILIWIQIREIYILYCSHVHMYIDMNTDTWEIYTSLLQPQNERVFAHVRGVGGGPTVSLEGLFRILENDDIWSIVARWKHSCVESRPTVVPPSADYNSCGTPNRIPTPWNEFLYPLRRFRKSSRIPGGGVFIFFTLAFSSSNGLERLERLERPNLKKNASSHSLSCPFLPFLCCLAFVSPFFLSLFVSCFLFFM